MKYYLLILFTISSLTTIYSQGYYPLQVGNVWEYCDCYDSLYPYQVHAVGDTTMPNGKVYTMLCSIWDTLYFRQEGSKVFNYSIYRLTDTTYLRIEEVWFDFSKSMFDTVDIRFFPNDTVIVTVVYYRLRNVFGKVRKQWGFYERSIRSSMYIIREVTDSLGITYITYEPGIIVDCLRGAIINGIKYGIITDVDIVMNSNPDGYVLSQNYPNPFNSSTMISLSAPSDYVFVDIFDMLGQQIKTLFHGAVSAGIVRLKWDGTNERGVYVGSGTYFYKIRSDNFNDIKKMILIR